MMTSNQKQFIYWVTERENIRLLKEQGSPKPWTDNKVMQETYFCNVNRENDKVTKWIRRRYKTIRPYTGNDEFNMIVARLVNKPESLKEMTWPFPHWEPYMQDRFLETMSKSGSWGSAYIVSTNGKKMKKHDYILEILRKAFEDLQFINFNSTLEEAHIALMGIRGLASFLAAQVVADLKNTEGHPLHEAVDWYSFSAQGPGSLRGLTWFFEEPVTAKNYHVKIKEAYDIIEFELPDRILDILCFQNLQNCFCEYDKFMRVTNKTGRSKRKYKGN